MMTLLNFFCIFFHQVIFIHIEMRIAAVVRITHLKLCAATATHNFKRVKITHICTI